MKAQLVNVGALKILKDDVGSQMHSTVDVRPKMVSHANVECKVFLNANVGSLKTLDVDMASQMAHPS